MLVCITGAIGQALAGSESAAQSDPSVQGKAAEQGTPAVQGTPAESGGLAAPVEYGRQGEHGRRAGAELRVLVGDVRHLTALAKSDHSPGLQQGLKDRVLGSLSSIDIVLRLADREAGRPPVSHRQLNARAAALISTGEWNALEALLLPVVEQYPLAMVPIPASKPLINSSLKLHQRLCAACHDVPATHVERPAYNLSQQARSITPVEFFARMLVGVRGDRITGIDNPLSDSQIAGLIYLYTSE